MCFTICCLIAEHHERSSVSSFTRGQTERNDGKVNRGLPYVDKYLSRSEATPISNGTHQDEVVALVTIANKQYERPITCLILEAIPGPSSWDAR